MEATFSEEAWSTEGRAHSVVKLGGGGRMGRELTVEGPGIGGGAGVDIE